MSHEGAHWRHLANVIKLDMVSSRAKMAQPIEMPFGLWTLVGPRKDV